MGHHPPFKQVEESRPDYELEQTFHYTKTPDPNWKPGQGISQAALPHRELFPPASRSDKDKNQEESHLNNSIKTFIPYENLSREDAYRLMINSIVPRPIGFCSTVSPQGFSNLAPFSYFNAVGSNPPCVMLSFSTGPNSEKDSALNIKQTKEFVVAIISAPFIEAANYTSINSPREVSEWNLAGLTPLPSIKVKPARVKEALINMECELEHFHEMFDPSDPVKLTQTLVIGQIKAWHISEDVLIDGGPGISMEKLMPMCRLGGVSYGRVTSGFELLRPVWKDEQERNEVQHLLKPASSC